MWTVKMKAMDMILRRSSTNSMIPSSPSPSSSNSLLRLLFSKWKCRLLVMMPILEICSALKKQNKNISKSRKKREKDKLSSKRSKRDSVKRWRGRNRPREKISNSRKLCWKNKKQSANSSWRKKRCNRTRSEWLRKASTNKKWISRWRLKSHVDHLISMTTQRLVCIRVVLARKVCHQGNMIRKETPMDLARSTTMKRTIRSSNHRVPSTYMHTKTTFAQIQASRSESDS